MKSNNVVQMEYIILVPSTSVMLLGEEKGSKYIEKDALSNKIPVRLDEEDALEVYKGLHKIFGPLPGRAGTPLARPPAKPTRRKTKKVSP
jgi:hypothetical protein